jgi:hypothetical protein
MLAQVKPAMMQLIIVKKRNACTKDENQQKEFEEIFH